MRSLWRTCLLYILICCPSESVSQSAHCKHHVCYSILVMSVKETEYVCTTVQKFGVGKVFKCFKKKSLSTLCREAGRGRELVEKSHSSCLMDNW